MVKPPMQSRTATRGQGEAAEQPTCATGQGDEGKGAHTGKELEIAQFGCTFAFHADQNADD
jgi:hypothetical protein